MIELTPQQQQFVDAQVASGLFNEPAEVIGVALDLLQQQQREHDEYIREELSKGVAAIEAGELVPWDPERIKQEGRRRLSSRKAPE
jgi:putative addiction module CopG family antidote